MKTTKTAKTLPLPLTGADHQAMALLRHIAGDTAGHWGYDELGKYIVAARTILHSKHAFTGSTDALSIGGYVMADERLRRIVLATEHEKAWHRETLKIIEGREGETVTGDAWDMQAFVHSAISEAELYGAAVMFELLRGEGGAR
jgi:hypothetical protein